MHDSTASRDARYDIPNLGSVEIAHDRFGPTITFRLVDGYSGDLRAWEQVNNLPQGVYFVGNSGSCQTSPEFTRFLEVMTHWDIERDGIFDCDHVILHIDEVFHEWSVASPMFVRPNGSAFQRLLMRLMPPAPERHIAYTFGELRPLHRGEHYKIAIPAIISVLGLINLQVRLIPALGFSPLTLWITGAESFGFLPSWVALIIFFVVLRFLRGRGRRRTRTMTTENGLAGTIRTGHGWKFGFFNEAAIYEEQAFREGYENWTRWERIRANLVFGAVHQSNLFYPFATILPLAVGGAIFGHIYQREFERTNFRRSAVLEAAVVHRVYNKVALSMIVLSVFLLAGGLLYSTLMSFVVFVVTYLSVAAIGNAIEGRTTSRPPALRMQQGQ